MGSGGAWLWGELLPAQMWGDVPCVAGTVLAVTARVAEGTEQNQPPGTPQPWSCWPGMGFQASLSWDPVGHGGGCWGQPTGFLLPL